MLISLSHLEKTFNIPCVYKQHVLKLTTEHQAITLLYTYSFKDGSKVGCAVFEKQFSTNGRLPDDSSIFTTEAKLLIWPCH